MSDQYKNEREIHEIVQGFESCTTSKDDFSHLNHLTVAVFYLQNSSESEATEKMREGLLRFLNHHKVGSQKFHETLTIFWIKTVLQLLAKLDPHVSLLERANAVIERSSDSRLVFEFYSKELLNSDEARKGWVEPDLKVI